MKHFYSLADKWGQYLLVKHFIVKRVQKWFLPESLLSVVDVDLVFTLASVWCLFPPSAVYWMHECGDFYTKLTWWAHCFENSLNPLKKHYITWIPKTNGIASSFGNPVCYVTLHSGGGESGFASSLFPLTISTIFKLWPYDYEVFVVLSTHMFLQPLTSGPANK